MRKKKPVGFLAAALACSFAVMPMAGAQSLWADDNGIAWSVFADRRAHNVGDILSIVISERTSLQAEKSSSNGKSGEQNLEAGVGIFDFFKAASISGSDSFKAEGTAEDTNRISANITVTVVELQPNGNMVVEGQQSIWQHKNEHKITFRGIVRPDDITAYNTVPSNKVANATVHFDGKGPLNAKQRQGILTQIFNILF
ncbi:MAG: flagellar basal body L-ring protein FlgH [Selenomonadaceae bacterium]|nr:flagellar basal body L-ring protein FlgH [Selenomonadaceae bacterium]MBR4695990.1 flagellar basal body L-ring protein FlgH [Selenomonadaceae bacterium]